MTVYLVGAGPGDPGLLSVRGAEVLGRADVVVYDRLVDPALLLLAPPASRFVDVGKIPGLGRSLEGAGRQDEINRLLVEHGRRGEVVVRLKGGDPFLFGRGGEEAEALDDAGVAWEVVPGVSSAFGVPAAAGIPVTHRGLSTSATVVTGHVGDPTAPGGVDWEALARVGGTVVVLMGMAEREEIARRLIEGGRPATTPVAVVEWGTTPGQRVEHTTLGALGDVDLGSPAVIVVGQVAGLELGAARVRQPLAGVGVVVTRPAARSTTTRDRLSDALAAAGARVLPVPSIAIAEPVDGGAALAEALARLAEYRWVVLTSQHAVEALFAGLDDVRALAAVRLAAVGSATAAALAARHLRADLLPDPGRSSAEGLVASFPGPTDHPERGAALAVAAPAGAALDGAVPRVLFPCADRARPTLSQGLREKGWVVDEVVAYRTLPATPPPDATLRAIETAPAITFSSPSAVEAYRGMRTSSGRALPVPSVVVCIGPTTAAAARAAGLDVAVEAPVGHPEAAVEGLVAALGLGAQLRRSP